MGVGGGGEGKKGQPKEARFKKSAPVTPCSRGGRGRASSPRGEDKNGENGASRGEEQIIERNSTDDTTGQNSQDWEAGAKPAFHEIKKKNATLGGTQAIQRWGGIVSGERKHTPGGEYKGDLQSSTTKTKRAVIKGNDDQEMKKRQTASG